MTRFVHKFSCDKMTRFVSNCLTVNPIKLPFPSIRSLNLPIYRLFPSNNFWQGPCTTLRGYPYTKMEYIRLSRGEVSLARKKVTRKFEQVSDHTKELVRFNRIKGQIEGVENMIREKRYCGEILNQLRAVKAGLSAIEASILETHLHNCVSDAIRSGKKNLAKEKIDEVIDLFKNATNKGVVIK